MIGGFVGGFAALAELWVLVMISLEADLQAYTEQVFHISYLRHTWFFIQIK